MKTQDGAKAGKSRSWRGYRVRLLRELVTRGGVVFAEGEEATVVKVFRGLSLRTDDGRQVTRVSKWDVRVIGAGEAS